MTMGDAIGKVGGWSSFSGPFIYVIRDGVVVLKTRTEGRAVRPALNTTLKPRDVVYIGAISSVP